MSCKTTKSTSDRLIYMDREGNPVCATCVGAIPVAPEFKQTLTALIGDLQLAVDCMGLFGGVPVPVKQAICRNIGAVQATLTYNHIMADAAIVEDLSEAN